LLRRWPAGDAAQVDEQGGLLGDGLVADVRVGGDQDDGVGPGQRLIQGALSSPSSGNAGA
jgi:hypothetical protein